LLQGLEKLSSFIRARTNAFARYTAPFATTNGVGTAHALGCTSMFVRAGPMAQRAIKSLHQTKSVP
jgi:hypothetical protein